MDFSDPHFWRRSCFQLCVWSETGPCNQQACPINCELTDYIPWSECSPCAQKQVRRKQGRKEHWQCWTGLFLPQLRTRSVLIPAQFGGAPCSEELMEERPCHPAKECKLPPLICKEQFKCDNGKKSHITLSSFLYNASVLFWAWWQGQQSWSTKSDFSLSRQACPSPLFFLFACPFTTFYLFTSFCCLPSLYLCSQKHIHTTWFILVYSWI